MIAIVTQRIASIGVTTAPWVGFSIFCGGAVCGIVGNLNKAFFKGQSISDVLAEENLIPLRLIATYPMMLVIIMPALISEAFTNRTQFPVYLFFSCSLVTPFLFSSSSYGGVARWTAFSMRSVYSNCKWDFLTLNHYLTLFSGVLGTLLL